MSYYILPKYQSKIPIELNFFNESFPFISSSLYYQYYKLKNHLNNYNSVELMQIEFLLNGNNYMCFPIGEENITISNLIQDKFFFEMYELYNSLSLFSTFKSDINIIILSNIKSIEDSIKCYRTNYNDNITKYDTFPMKSSDIKSDLLIVHLNDNNDNINNIIKTISFIENNLHECGNCIINISNLNSKLNIDLIFLLTSLFDKCFILKPNISDVNQFNLYIVCKNFNNNNFNYSNQLLNINLESNMNSLLLFSHPVYFLNKLNDISIILGQQHLEFLFQIIYVLSNNSFDDKKNVLIKNAIEKCTIWCEKNKISYNKFLDKTNIFLLSNNP